MAAEKKEEKKDLPAIAALAQEHYLLGDNRDLSDLLYEKAVGWFMDATDVLNQHEMTPEERQNYLEGYFRAMVERLTEGARSSFANEDAYFTGGDSDDDEDDDDDE